MVVTNPKYLLYFDMYGDIIYQNDEIVTIKKIISNVINSRFYIYDIEIKFNEEIINYNAIKDKLSNNVLLLITEINDLVVEDLIDEVLYILGKRKVIRLRTTADFNKTGLSDKELIDLYEGYLSKFDYLQSIDYSKFASLYNNYKIENIPSINAEDKLIFSSLFLDKYKDLNGFSFFDDFSVINCLFNNFEYLLKYFSLIDLNELVIYYQKEAIKYIRQIRFYVSHSEDYNDNIKEIILYNHIIKKFNNNKFIYDPEEGLNLIREEFDRISESRREYLINEINKRFNLFNGDYNIINLSDVDSKIYSSYKYISNYIHKHFGELGPLIKSFKLIDNYIVKYNSKMVNDDIVSKALNKMKEHRIIKDYTVLHGSYTIYLYNGEHIAFLQGKWFEYYTAKICEEAILNYEKQGYYPDYGIYQNLVIKIDGVKRELDIVIYLNDNIFYIENKIDGKRTLKYDIEKYNDNIKHMNVSKNNCYLVSLESEDTLFDSIRVCSVSVFLSKFKKDCLKILEEHKSLLVQKLKEEEIRFKKENEINSLINKNINSLYLENKVESEKEKLRFLKVIDKYENEVKKIEFSDFNSFFEIIAKCDIKDEIKKQKVSIFIENYQNEFLNYIENNNIDKILKMIEEILEIDDPVFNEMAVPLIIFTNNYDALEYLDPQIVLTLFCSYGIYKPAFAYLTDILIFNSMMPINKPYLYAYISRLKSIDYSCVEEFQSLIISNIFRFNEFIRNNKTQSYINQVLLQNSEFEFTCALIYIFMNKVFGKVYIDGIKFENIPRLIDKLTLNNQYYIDAVRNELQDIVEGLDIYQDYFSSRKVESSAANYLFLNRKKLIGCNLFFDVDPNTLTFKIKRSEQSLKLLRLLKEESIIANYKEVKKADVYIAIFVSNEHYLWYSNGNYIGQYLSTRFDVNKYSQNFYVRINNTLYTVMFIKVMDNNVVACLMDISNLKCAIFRENKETTNDKIRNLSDNDFKYSIDEIVDICNKLIGGQDE